MASDEKENLTLLGKARLAYATNWKPYWEAIGRHGSNIQPYMTEKQIRKLHDQIANQLGSKIMAEVRKDYQTASDEDKKKVNDFIKWAQEDAKRFYNRLIAVKGIEPIKARGGRLKKFIS